MLAVALPLTITSLSVAGVFNMTTAFSLLAAAWFISTFSCFVAANTWAYLAARHVLLKVIICLVPTALFSYLAVAEAQARYAATHLTPDNMPDPYNNCGNKPNTFYVLMGDTTFSVKDFPHTIVAIGDERDAYNLPTKPLPLLQVGKLPDGSLSIKILRIFDHRNNVITSVHDDRPWGENSNFRVERPNSHSLLAFGQNDSLVLNLYFLNRSTLEVVSEVFRGPRGGTVRITKHLVEARGTGKFFTHNVCFTGSGIDIYVPQGGPAIAGWG